MELTQFYNSEMLPNIPYEQLFSNCNPKDKGNHLIIDCPGCGKPEGYVYKSTGAISCNRKNQCAYKGNILSFLNEGDRPTGQRYIEIIKQLCEMTGVPFPKKEYTKHEIDSFESRDRKQQLFKDFQAIVLKELESKIGEDALKYLESRGLPKEEAYKRSFGFYPNSDLIEQELKEMGYLPAEIYESGLYRSDWNGRLILPIKEHGNIGEFVAVDITRTVASEKKYLRMSNDKAVDNTMLMGLDRAGHDIVLVEGYFDYLTPNSAGLKNFVALGGSNMWDSHVKKLVQHKIKSVTLLLDNDQAGNDGRISIFQRLANTEIDVYIISPDKLGDAKDPDEFIKKYGSKEIVNILGSKENGFRHYARDIAQHHNKSGQWADSEQAEALDEAKRFEQRISNQNRHLALNFFWEEFVEKAGINQDVIDRCRQDEQRRRETADIDLAFQEGKKLLEQGRPDEAKNLLLKAADDIKAKQSPNKSFQVQFIKDCSTNFLLTEAPPMPSLVTMTDKDIRSIFIPRGIVGSVVGAGGIGKTHWLAQLALSVTTGRLFLSEYTVTKIGHVALVLGENSSDDIHRLLRKTIKGFARVDDEIDHEKLEDMINKASERLAPMSVTGMDASFINANGNPSFFYEQFLNELIKNEPEEGWALIILDPISRFLGADAETDNAKATLFISLLENMNQKLRGNPTILFGHHMNKNSRGQENSDASASRGASGLTDGVRWQLNLDSVKVETEVIRDKIKMNVTKSNHTGYPPARILKKDSCGHLKILGEEEAKVFLTAQKENVDKKAVTNPQNKFKEKDDTVYKPASKQQNFMDELAGR
jgi:DNA primase catalytic core